MERFAGICRQTLSSSLGDNDRITRREVRGPEMIRLVRALKKVPQVSHGERDKMVSIDFPGAKITLDFQTGRFNLN